MLYVPTWRKSYESRRIAAVESDSSLLLLPSDRVTDEVREMTTNPEYDRAVSLLRDGEPLPVDLEASLMNQGYDVSAMYENHQQ